MTATMLVILLLVLGFVLLAVEILVIPGFGLIGLLGLGGVAGAVAIAFGTLSTGWGLGALGIGVGVSALMVLVLPRTGMGRAMVLEHSQRGNTSAAPGLAELEGQLGEAVTTLRPSGSARIGERVIDVVADGAFVEAGARVRVIKVEGSRVVVEPVPISS
jgi:membrane-bound serine protease (ClpP class)